MKRKIRLLIFAAFFLALTGCSEKNPVQTVCRWEQSEITLTAENDRVTAEKESAFLSYDELGIGADKEDLDELIDALFQQYSAGREGIQCTVSKEEAGLSVVLELDLEKVSFIDLQEIGFIQTAGEEISLQKTVSELEARGYSCIEDRGE